ARAQPGALQLRRVAGAHLSAYPRRQAARHARPIGKTAQTIRLDSPDRLSGEQRALRRRALELARAEARAAGIGVPKLLVDCRAPARDPNKYDDFSSR